MTNEQMDKIERYLNRQMTGEELKDFRNEMENDPELRKEFNLMRLTNATLQRDAAKYEAFKKKFIEARPGALPDKKPFWFLPWLGWAIALILAGYVIWLHSNAERPRAEDSIIQPTQPLAILEGEEDILVGGGGGIDTAVEKEGEIILFFSPDEFPAEHKIRVFSLRMGGRKYLFFKIDEKVYRIDLSNNRFFEEKDEKILEQIQE